MIGWLAQPTTWGPLVRALGVLHETPGHLLAIRGDAPSPDWAPLDAYRIPYTPVPCCEDMWPPARWLAELDADVLVADSSWWADAVADGRPCLRIGFASQEPDWDLDLGPIHPWAWMKLPTRAEVRSEWGVPDSTPVVACMSNWQYQNILENRVASALPAGAELVSLRGWGVARQMVGADLVVATAGWASSWEARWSGVPHCLLDVGGPDGLARVTHDMDAARVAVARVHPAGLPPGHTADPEPAQHALRAFLESVARLR